MIFLLRLNFNIHFWSLKLSLIVYFFVCLFNDTLRIVSLVPVCRRYISNDFDDRETILKSSLQLESTFC
jgi:hypothetical protein